MDKAALLKDLRPQVAALEDDLRARTDSVARLLRIAQTGGGTR